MSVVLVNAWDPLGNHVLLYEQRYLEHIWYRHPGIEPRHIQQVIEAPDVITVDEADPLVNLYYARGVIQTADSARYSVKVCVRIRSDSGVVMSAYEVLRPKGTERVIWRRP